MNQLSFKQSLIIVVILTTGVGVYNASTTSDEAEIPKQLEEAVFFNKLDFDIATETKKTPQKISIQRSYFEYWI